MAKYLLLRGGLVLLKTGTHCGMPIFLKVTTNWRAGSKKFGSPVRREGQSLLCPYPYLSPGFQPWEPSPHGDAPQRGARSSVTRTYKYNVIIYVPIARPCFGAHHFLHQKSNAILAVRRTPVGGACLFDRNLAGLGVRPASGRRCGRSRPYSLRTLQKDLPRRIDQESQNQLDQNRKRQGP